MAGRGGAPAGDSSRGGGRGLGKKEEGGEGILPPCSPWAIAHGGGGSTGEQRAAAVLLVAAQRCSGSRLGSARFWFGAARWWWCRP
jgi:hypothetical protein